MTESSASWEMRSPPGVTACVEMVWYSQSTGAPASCARRSKRGSQRAAWAAAGPQSGHHTHLKNLDDCVRDLGANPVAGKQRHRPRVLLGRRVAAAAHWAGDGRPLRRVAGHETV